MKVRFLVLLLLPASFLTAQQKEKDIFSLTLKELREVKVAVPAALTKLAVTEIPASLRVITSEDIKRTPARNIYDLIEVYVPGSIWMDYEDGPQLGIRGNIVNRNFKYLIRVNGRIMNNKGHYGAKSELEQWSLADIQRIEIVGGPGSVVYGPGAVAGVINIIIHDADSAGDGLSISGQGTSQYNSRGLSISHAFKRENFKVYSFASLTRTPGAQSRHFLGASEQAAGYIGEDILPDETPLDYFADYEDKPQIKVHFDVSFHNHWQFWTRYTRQGSSWKGDEVKSSGPEGLLNQQGVQDQQWTGTLQYENELSQSVSLSSMLSIDSNDVERRRKRLDNPDPNHALNKEINFCESELFFRTIVNWQVSQGVEIAFGAEYALDFFGPGWGENEDDMRLGERGHIISGPMSNALQTGVKGSADRFGNELYVGDGWNTNTFSLFSESNITFNPKLKLLLSARVDKNTYSDLLFSPRLALITGIGQGHEIKLIGQQAQRMSTAGQLYALNQNNHDPETETLTGVEIIYTRYSQTPLSFNAAAFWNDAEVIAWDNGIQSTNIVGDLQLFGFEPKLSYKLERGEIGLSYSFVKQIEWELAEGVFASGISYSDYNQPLSGSDAIQMGQGNDLNNWPNQSLKLNGHTRLSEACLLHLDAQFVWDYQGARDGLTALENSLQGLPEEAAAEETIARVYEAGAYGDSFRLSASLSYVFHQSLSLQIFSQNLLSRGRNKRYSHDFSGNNKPFPSRVRFSEEPATVGLVLSGKF